MNARPSPHIPWHRRLGVRVGVAVAAVVLAVDRGNHALYNLASTDKSSQDLERMQDIFERTGEVRWFTPQEERSILLGSLGFAILLACFGAWLVSRLATGRLARLARLAASPVSAEQLPGPFLTSGGDEIATLALSLNGMRARVMGLLSELELRDTQRRDWIAQVSHDLRTPMTALSIALGRAERLLSTPDEEARQEALEMVSASTLDVARVQSLADDLLEIARLEAGDSLRLEPVPLGELVRSTITALNPLAKDRGVRLWSQLPTGLPLLMADGRRLQRALENLVANALRHSKTSVQVDLEISAKEVCFVVRDDGAGFPTDTPELTPAALALLPRAADSANLGLQVATRVATAHAGQLTARNRASGGAELRLRIARVEA